MGRLLGNALLFLATDPTSRQRSLAVGSDCGGCHDTQPTNQQSGDSTPITAAAEKQAGRSRLIIVAIIMTNSGIAWRRRTAGYSISMETASQHSALSLRNLAPMRADLVRMDRPELNGCSFMCVPLNRLRYGPCERVHILAL